MRHYIMTRHHTFLGVDDSTKVVHGEHRNVGEAEVFEIEKVKKGRATIRHKFGFLSVNSKGVLKANKAARKDAEVFRIFHIDRRMLAIQSEAGLFMFCGASGRIRANQEDVSGSERFVPSPADPINRDVPGVVIRGKPNQLATGTHSILPAVTRAIPYVIRYGPKVWKWVRDNVPAIIVIVEFLTPDECPSPTPDVSPSPSPSDRPDRDDSGTSGGGSTGDGGTVITDDRWGWA